MNPFKRLYSYSAAIVPAFFRSRPSLPEHVPFEHPPWQRSGDQQPRVYWMGSQMHPLPVLLPDYRSDRERMRGD